MTKQHDILIKDFNTFMDDQHNRKNIMEKNFLLLFFFFCKILLKRHIKNCFEIIYKQIIKMPKKDE